MKYCKWIVAIVAMLTFACDMSFAQNSSSAQSCSGSGNAKILQPIQLVGLRRNLNFGSIIPSGTTDGSVVITPDAAFSSNTGSFTYNTIGTTSQGQIDDDHATLGEARFQAVGEPGCSFTISLPSEVLMITNISSGQKLKVTDFTSNPPSPATLDHTGVLGQCKFNVGATLHVPASQVNGWYNGEFAVSIAYE